MLAIIGFAGVIVGWASTSSPLGGIGGGVLAIVGFMAVQYAIGSRSVREATKAVPVDLTATVPARLTADAYAAMPLASNIGKRCRGRAGLPHCLRNEGNEVVDVVMAMLVVDDLYQGIADGG
jgi:hypothetical protein